MSLLEHYPYYLQFGLTLAVKAFSRVRGKRCTGYETIAPRVDGKVGLEIGGPSGIFKDGNLIPVYGRARAIDSCNFRDQTVWTRKDESAAFGDCLRERFVCEATDLSVVAGGSYDFVLASHVLEHIANPLKALREWSRVVRPGGIVLAIVPHKARTFDVRRPVTPMQHLIDDYEKQTQESDLAHVEEVVRLHDWRRDPGIGGPEQLEARSLANLENRCVHHHVFSPESLASCFELCGMETLNLTVEYPYHIVGMARRALEDR